MRVSVQNTGGLKRRITVAVPAGELEREVGERLRKIRRNARLPGFRPGKAPPKIIEAKFGRQALLDAAGELIESSYRKALGEHGLSPAGRPHIEQTKMERGSDLEYVARFEVLPKITHTDLSGCKVKKFKSEVREADIDRDIENLRKQRLSWNAVQREARDGDRVIVDFSGTVDGAPFDGGAGEKYPALLGAGALLPDFERGLRGLRGGESREITVTFSADYPNEKVRGKRAVFAVTAAAVEESSLPAVDDEFVRALGIKKDDGGDGDLQTLRDSVRGSLQRELENRTRSLLRSEVMRQLLARNNIEAPAQLVDAEMQRMIETRMRDAARHGIAFESSQLDDKTRAALTEEARQRVALGLTVHEVIKAHGLGVTRRQVSDHLRQMAAGRENRDDLVRWTMAEPQRMAAVESMLLEEKVVDALLATAKVKEKTVPFSEVMNAAAN